MTFNSSYTQWCSCEDFFSCLLTLPAPCPVPLTSGFSHLLPALPLFCDPQPGILGASLSSHPLTPEICMSTSLLYPQPSCSSLPSLTSLLSFLLGASRYTQVGEFGLFHKWTSPGQRAGRERGPASGLHQSCPLPEPSIMSS